MLHSNVTIVVNHLRRGKYVVCMIKLQNNCVILLDEIAKYMETVKLLDYVEKHLFIKRITRYSFARTRKL